MLGSRGGKWHLPAPLFLEWSPCNPYVSRPCSEMSKSLCLLSVLISFSNSWFYKVSAQDICCAIYWVLPEQTLWFFKFQALSSAGFKNSWKSTPSYFQRQILERFVFPVPGLPGIKVCFLSMSVTTNCPPTLFGPSQFCSQIMFHPSCVLQCGLFPAFSYGICSISLWVIS